MKPGWKTSEFWQAAVAQVFALLTILHVIAQNDSKTLEVSVTNCVTAIFALAANGMIVVNYIKGRVNLKAWNLTTPPYSLLFAATVGLAILLSGGTAHAQSILPWRSGIVQQLKEHDQKLNQMIGKSQQVPQIIMMQPPLQALPIQGKPEQSFPNQGQPKQDFPLQGQPKQVLPIEGQPRQDLPTPGSPRQDFPLMPPAALTEPQRYSVIRAIGSPIP